MHVVFLTGKRSTAPLAGGSSSSTTPAAGGNGNTATLGLRRFGELPAVGSTSHLYALHLRLRKMLAAWPDQGSMSEYPNLFAEVCRCSCCHAAGFKSRALRVGGGTDPPAAAEAAATNPAAVAPQPDVCQEAATADMVTASDEGHDVAGAGRKRRAAANSVPSPSVSPKLAAAVRHGQQCRVQPGEEATGAGSGGKAPGSQAATTASRGGGEQPCAAPQQAAWTASPADDDTVPLVGSKLAARVSHERGTPLAAGRGRDAGRLTVATCAI